MPDKEMLYPRPKSFEALPGRWRLPTALCLAAASDPERRAAEVLAGSLRAITGGRLRVGRFDACAAGIRLALRRRIAGGGGQPEGYTLTVREAGVEIAAATERGLAYGGRTLLGLLRSAPDGALAAPCCRIHDWPDFACRGFMLNPATTFVGMKELGWQLDLLARNKMNLLHMNFADAVSFTLPTRRFPRLNDPPDETQNGVYSRSDIRRMLDWAAARHIDILPGINMPGHARYWLRQYPELRCEAPRASAWVMCVGQERTFDMIEALFDEILPLFPYPFVHIGTDELEFRDALERVWLSWRECPHCRRRMAQEGLSGVRQLFYYFVRRIHRMLAQRGKRLTMWNDNVDSGRPVDLPRDIRMHFWRVAAAGRGPRAGCSLNRLAARGFDVVCSPYRNTYIDVHARDESVLAWNPERCPPVRRDLRRRVLGGIGCSWRGKSKYPPEYYEPPFLAMLGDRLWNRAPIRDADAFARGLARHLFGPCAPDALEDLLHLDGRIIHNAAGRYDDEPGVLSPLPPSARRQRRTAVIAALEAVLRSRTWDAPTAAAFLAQFRGTAAPARRGKK